MTETTTARPWEPGQTWLPKPGIYRGVEAAQYHSCPYASNSRLRYLVPPSTPAHLQAALEELPKDKKVWKEGRVLHACVLEFERYNREYMRAQQCMAVTDKGKRCSREAVAYIEGDEVLCAQHAKGEVIDESVLIVSAADDDMARGARRVFLSNPITAGFLRAKDAEFELTIIWDDPVTGVRCKARIDWYSPTMFGGLPMDLKGARDASEREFTKQAIYNGYLRQSVLYRRALYAHGLPAASFAGVAQEKVRPYELNVFLIGDDATGAIAVPGEEAVLLDRQVNALLRTWDRCQTSGLFPGYERRIITMTTPEWGWSMIEDQTRRLEEALEAQEAAA